MQKRVIVFLILSLLSVLISVSFISALNNNTCGIMSSSACTSEPYGHAVMGLSSSTNAHGQSPYSSYPNVLCCAFGSGNTTCSTQVHPVYGSSVPKNKIIGLSSSTNAHAETTGGTNYGTNVCYQAGPDNLLVCVSTTSCDSTYYLPILSLSSTTNAHLGNFSDYSTKICCGIIGFSGGSCSLTSATWTYNNAKEDVQVKLNVTGTNCGGASISFNISDSDGNVIGNPGDMAFPSGGSSITQTWTSQYRSGHPNNYKFTAKVIATGISIQSGSPNSTLHVTQRDANYCTAVSTCGKYLDAADCGSDVCTIAQDDPNADPDAYSYGCEWNSTTSKCNFVNLYQGSGAITCKNGLTLCTATTGSLLKYCYPGSSCPTSQEQPLINGNGVCNTGEGCSSTLECHDGNQDTCIAGATCLSGLCSSGSSIVQNETACGNKYHLCKRTANGVAYCYSGAGGTCPAGSTVMSNSCIPPSVDVSGVCTDTTTPIGKCTINFIDTGDTCEDGFLQYQWTATWAGTGTKPASCANGERVIECPAQIPLPFFTPINAAVTVTAIIAVYLIMILVKKSHKGKHLRRKK